MTTRSSRRGKAEGRRELFKTADSGDRARSSTAIRATSRSTRRSPRTSASNLKAKYAGSEAAELTELDTAYQNRSPILMYFWTPHWALAEVRPDEVKLPKVTDACCEINTPGETRRPIQLRLPDGRAVQGVQPGSADKGPGGVRVPFGDAVGGRRPEQRRARHPRGLERSDAAQKWIDANPTVWQPWVDAGMAAQNGSRDSRVTREFHARRLAARGGPEGPPLRVATVTTESARSVAALATPALHGQHVGASSPSWQTCPRAPRP